jgi:hypothetical protein
MDAIAMEYWGKGVTAFLAGLCAKYRLAGLAVHSTSRSLCRTGAMCAAIGF